MFLVVKKNVVFGVSPLGVLPRRVFPYDLDYVTVAVL